MNTSVVPVAVFRALLELIFYMKWLSLPVSSGVDLADINSFINFFCVLHIWYDVMANT